MDVRWIVAGVLLVTSVAAGIAMRPSIRTMKAHGGKGIVALELARTPDDVATIRRVWGPRGDAAARTSIWIDFVLVAGYAGLLAFVAGWTAVSLDGIGRPGWARFAAVLMVAFAVAGLCDVVENAGMLAELAGSPDEVRRHLPMLVSALATVKFALLLAGFPLLVTVLVARAAR
jgi:hypothetical protein